jgi:dihydrofolate reductase
MKISLIVAMAENRVIGSNGKMPWHLSADLKRFKQITLGSPIVMGRKTHEAIGRPLPGRSNIIVSKNKSYRQQNCLVFNDIDSALQHCAECAEIFVIGGSTLYQALLPRANYLYLTEINKNFVGDVYFPKIDARQWRELERQVVEKDESVDFTYNFIKLEQIKNLV